jgi:large subunit ribosomal protein L21
MFAVFKSGGKQHRVSEGEVVRLELIDAEPGASLTFDEVLLVAEGDNVTVGAPYVAGGKVTARLLDTIGTTRFESSSVAASTTCRAGHRQWYTDVRITGIKG